MFADVERRLGRLIEAGRFLEALAREAKLKHDLAFQPLAEYDTELPVGGNYAYRVRGEYHRLNPETVSKMQHAVRQESFATFQEYTKLVDDESTQHCTIRGLLGIRPAARGRRAGRPASLP